MFARSTSLKSAKKYASQSISVRIDNRNGIILSSLKSLKKGDEKLVEVYFDNLGEAEIKMVSCDKCLQGMENFATWKEITLDSNSVKRRRSS